MSVTKLVIQAAIIAGLLSTTTRGDAILTLGLFTTPTVPNSTAPAYSGPSLNLASTDSTNQVVPASNTALALATSTAPTPSLATTPVINSSPPTFQTSPAPAATSTYDAFINFGNGPFLNANSLTTGNAQAWYDSSKIVGLFGGQPNAQQIASFDSTVLQRVQQTFALSGVPVTLTDNPNDSAAHMLSVVSNTVNPNITSAIGMTNIGGNGFHYIDNSATYAQSVDQLEWIVAHNLAHELMLAFGVPEVNDQTGRYVDSTVGQMSMFLNPNATFSSGAVQDLLSKNFLQTNASLFSSQAQLMGPSAVPEPATLAVWAIGVLALVAARRARSRRVSA